MQTIDLVELLYQTGGEFNERFEARGLTIVTKLPHNSVMIRADGRQLYRAIENLYTNAAKYALENTRVYVDLEVEENNAVFRIKIFRKSAAGTGSGEERPDGAFCEGRGIPHDRGKRSWTVHCKESYTADGR